MDSTILAKYSSQIAKAKECFSYSRDIFTYWNSSQISYLAMTLEKSDFYLYLVESKFIVIEFVNCKKCAGPMTQRLNKSKPEGIVWACNNSIGNGIHAKKCNSSRSARFNTWFYKSKLTLPEILLLTYLWWAKLPQIFVHNEFRFSPKTLVDWASFCREVAIDVVFKHSEKIGGAGVIVEIDETKFGKSKF